MKMSMMIVSACLFVACGMFAAGRPDAALGKPGEPVTFSMQPKMAKVDGKWIVTFTVSQKTDIEVAVLGTDATIVRHLAAGVMGADAPPPAPLKAGLAQSIEWDGKDDYGQPVAGAANCSVRVRGGMGVKLVQLVGGDPYAYESNEMQSQGDHAAWRITGLDAKSDGNVYVIGNANFFGPPALRQYDGQGNYRRTVFPPPADKPIEDVKGWGVSARPDGSYAPLYSDLSSPGLGRTHISWIRAGCARLFPTPDVNTLTLRGESRFCWNRLMTIGTDGTLREYKPVPEFSDPPLSAELGGTIFTALVPDGKSMYVSGLFEYNERAKVAATNGFWRDGHVWKVDLATRKASVFYAMDESKVIASLAARRASPIGHANPNIYAAFHGVAVDAEGNVLVCDRQNKRIVALNKDGKLIREIPLANPDAIVLNPKSKALYVTTRFGNYHKYGEMNLVKFNDWTKDSEPTVTLPLCKIGLYTHNSFLAVSEVKGEILIWVAYTTLPVRIYRDKGAALELVKDFYEAGTQRALDLQHMTVDPVTDEVYVSDGGGTNFRISDWKNPKLVSLPFGAVDVALDVRNRRLYAHTFKGPVLRYKLDGQTIVPDPVGSGNVLTAPFCDDWRIGLGISSRGLAVAPDGSLATLGAFISQGGDNYTGFLNYFKADATKAPWEPMCFDGFNGGKGKGRWRTGGIRFDPEGNLYVGKTDGDAMAGRIYKFTPTGVPGSGNLFPAEPSAPAKVYNIRYGSLGPDFARTPRFGVDGYGRIYYPSSLDPQVSVIDNEGNEILHFGTYGNRDSMGGLPGDFVPTKGIPMAWPNSVDATDDYIYVTDIVNIRLMRLAKTFAMDSSAKK